MNDDFSRDPFEPEMLCSVYIPQRMQHPCYHDKLVGWFMQRFACKGLEFVPGDYGRMDIYKK